KMLTSRLAHRRIPRDLRHTISSLSVHDGANVKALKRILGERSEAMTSGIYADYFDDDLAAVADALDRAIASASVGTRNSRRSTRINKRSVSCDDIANLHHFLCR
ncbi:MAG: hypothetical protein ABI382_01075, partial [Nakamurella sp.]